MSRPPNILITGTPGTGKTCTAEQVAAVTGFKHIEVGKLVKEKDLHSGWDEEFQCFTLDEDKVCDELEPIMAEGGVVLDMHTCGFFPERWFDLVVVLRASNSVLFPRMEKRGYNPKKINENIECEIFQVVLDEARESYKEEIIVELQSNCIEELQANVARIQEWVHARGGASVTQ